MYTIIPVGLHVYSFKFDLPCVTNHACTAMSDHHWVDTWWANSDVSPSHMVVVDRLDLKISDYIQSEAI